MIMIEGEEVIEKAPVICELTHFNWKGFFSRFFHQHILSFLLVRVLTATTTAAAAAAVQVCGTTATDSICREL